MLEAFGALGLFLLAATPDQSLPQLDDANLQVYIASGIEPN